MTRSGRESRAHGRAWPLPKGAVLAAAVVVVINAATLASVARNRSGEAEAMMTLTERELSLPPRDAENTALALNLEWVDPEILRPGPGWFDRRKLQEVGFDCRPEPGEGSRTHYRMMPPRAIYAVLEFEGGAWERYLAEPSVPVPGRSFSARHAELDSTRRARRSHLVLVDAGTDPAALRARYPDRGRHVVVPATASLTIQEDGGRFYLEGRVTTLLPMQLNVATAHRQVLERFQRDAVAARMENEGRAPVEHEPRYQATVKWGRSLEPWLVDVRAIAP